MIAFTIVFKKMQKRVGSIIEFEDMIEDIVKKIDVVYKIMSEISENDIKLSFTSPMTDKVKWINFHFTKKKITISHHDKQATNTCSGIVEKIIYKLYLHLEPKELIISAIANQNKEIKEQLEMLFKEGPRIKKPATDNTKSTPNGLSLKNLIKPVKNSFMNFGRIIKKSKRANTA